METFLKGGERSLKARNDDEQATHDREVRELRPKLGGLVLELDARKKRMLSPETRLTVQSSMWEAGKRVSIAQLCRWFGVPRSTFYYRPPADRPVRCPPWTADVAGKIRAMIDAEPAAGLRMITARLRREVPVNRKNVHRILKLNRWQCRRRPQGHRPRAQGWA